MRRMDHYQALDKKIRDVGAVQDDKRLLGMLERDDLKS